MAGAPLSLAPRTRPWVVGRGPQPPALASAMCPPHRGHRRAPLSTPVRSAFPAYSPPGFLLPWGVKKKKKAKSPPPRPCPCPSPASPLPFLPLAHSASATHTFLLFLQVPGPFPPPDLCMGCSLWNPLEPCPPQTSTCLLPHPLQVSAH